jgi:DNA sulfur modification protein DndD
MKLLSIQLCNFRQFYGKTPWINIASGEQNTTIIHGNNGAGKTTILNAITWALYEKFTPAFASPELLVNKRAVFQVEMGSSVECLVEVLFEHHNKNYQVKRRCFAFRDQNGVVQYGKTHFFISVAGDDGRWFPTHQQAEDVIEGILPQGLHQYFFFDGERLDHIFRLGQRSKISEDTKELIGVKVLERAIEHLKRAKKTLQEELTNIGSLEIRKLLGQQTKLEREVENTNKYRQEIEREISNQEDLKKTVNGRLLELSGAEELQKLKQKLEEQEKSHRHNLIDANHKIKKAISTKGYTVFLPEIMEQFHSLIDNLRAKGQIPSGIKQRFVQQLLEEKSCICGRDLEHDTLPYQQVESWMNRAGIADVEESAIRLETQVTEVNKQLTEFWQDVDKEQVNIRQWRTELSQIETQLEDVKNKLRRYPDEDIKQLQKRVDTIEARIKELTLEQGSNQQKIETLTKEIEDITKQISRQKIREEKQSIAQRRLRATEEVIARLIEVKERLEREFRLSLEQKVIDIFRSISFTPYLPRITENYELNLIENTSGIAVSVAASTGENQILSLSFIGGIIDRVREWSQKNTLMGFDSSTFPIVMDSPFGSLDEIYRRQVAKSLPKLANQLVVLVTKTQWRGEVEQEISSFIGKEYVLVYHSPKLDCEEDLIEINGQNYSLVKPSPNQFEYTEIIEVDRYK